MIRKYPHLIITVLASLLFITFLGNVHLFDWDEINFAEAAREMIVSKNYSRVQINFEPFWEKPPLFFWMQAASMKLFGINEFAARFPNAVCGILTLNFLFYYGKKWYSARLAWWWVLLFVGSFTPHFYFRSGIIDPFFNLFIFLSVVQLYLGEISETKRAGHFILSGILLGLALLTKGPVAVLIVGLCGLVYLIVRKFKPFFNYRELLLLVVSLLIIPLMWFIPDWLKNGSWFTGEFLKYQFELFLHPVASHGQPWFYHPLVLLIGCFPAAIIALPYLFKTPPLKAGGLVGWMKVLFWVVLILFSLVTTKIIHYSSLCYIPLTFLGAWGLFHSGEVLKAWQRSLILVIGIAYGILITLIPFLASGNAIQSRFFKIVEDDFVKANLIVNSNWEGFEWILGVAYLGVVILSLLLYKIKSGKTGLRILLLGNAAYLFLISIFIVPKIENHIQGRILSFYKKLQQEDCYVETIGFKSYAHYYYTQKPLPGKNEKLNSETKGFCRAHKIDTTGHLSDEQRNFVRGFQKKWFLEGEVDKPVYLVCKITNTGDLETNERFILVFNQGGYKVFKREK